MKPTPLILLALACLLCVPASAAVEYPQEYYTLEGLSSQYTDQQLLQLAERGAYPTVAVQAAMSVFELRRQTILIERQNELLAEQNALLQKLIPRDENSSERQQPVITWSCVDVATGENISCSGTQYTPTTNHTKLAYGEYCTNDGSVVIGNYNGQPVIESGRSCV